MSPSPSSPLLDHSTTNGHGANHPRRLPASGATRPRARGGRRPASPFDRPLDHALERLRAHGLPYKPDEKHFSTWHAVCPVCRFGDWTLTLREHGIGGDVASSCGSGCAEADVRAALEREPVDERLHLLAVECDQALDLAEECRHVAEQAIEIAERAA